MTLSWVPRGGFHIVEYLRVRSHDAHGKGRDLNALEIFGVFVFRRRAGFPGVPDRQR
jgi:hypothetical protein